MKKDFFNKKLFPFGEKYVITIGGNSRGWLYRNLIISNLEVNEENDVVVEESSFDDYDFVVKDGKVTSLIYKRGCNALLYIDSYGGYSRRRNGAITFRKWDYSIIPKEDTSAYAVWGMGADGDAGRIGQWDIVLFKCNCDAIVTVQTSGHYDDRCAIKFPKNEHMCWFDSLEELHDCYELAVADNN